MSVHAAHSSIQCNAAEINHQAPVLIVAEVDVLSKENKLWLLRVVDDWQHHALIPLTINYTRNLDANIFDRCDSMEFRGFMGLQTVQLIHKVLKQQAQRELSPEDAQLSLRTVDRWCDKLALQLSQLKPALRFVKS
jgi:hypothetical protein